MKILFLDQFSEIGGGQRVLIDLLPTVQQRGWGAHVGVPPGGPLIEQLRSNNIDVSEIPCGPYRSGSKGWRDLARFAIDARQQARIIRAVLNREDFDLVYVNGPRLLPAATLAAGRAAPILFHVHYPILQAAAARLAGWCVRRSGADVVACSSSARESLAPYIDSAKVHVIRNGTRDFGLRERTFDRRSWRIGLVGRISPQKGQVEFLEAAKLLAAQFPATRFVICGAPLFGAEEYLAQVKALALELPVDFLGWREDIASVLGDLDLLVMPSKEEGTPLVLLEAFSAGVPVVAFPAGGIREVMIDRETGFLVEPATSEALARRIGELMAGDPAVLKQVAGQARRVWEQSHTLDGYHNRITKLMEETASAWRAKHETTAPRERK